MRHILVIAVVLGGVYLLYRASQNTPYALAAVPQSCLYQVQMGDELKNIAAAHGLSTVTLWQQNHAVIGNNPDLIYPGQQLNVCQGDYQPASQVTPNPATATDATTAAIRADMLSVFGAVYGPGAIRIAICESGINPEAFDTIEVYWNGVAIGHAQGVFQIVDATWARTPYARYSPYNAWANIRAAHWLFVHDGYNWRLEWSTWQCAN